MTAKTHLTLLKYAVELQCRLVKDDFADSTCCPVLLQPVRQRYSIAGEETGNAHSSGRSTHRRKREAAKPQDLVDAGFQTLIAQYCSRGGQVRPRATLNGDDGPPLTVPLNVGRADKDQFHALKVARRYFDSSDMTTGFATIPVNFRGNEYVYVVACANGEEAAALFVLDRRTGGTREDITLVTRMDLPVGDVGLSFASPSNWRGRRTTISISALA
jgi:hypothetical protein